MFGKYLLPSDDHQLAGLTELAPHTYFAWSLMSGF